MIVARAVSAAARRAPRSVVTNLSHRGFAVAASQQSYEQKGGDHSGSSRVGKLLVAAAAAAGMSPIWGDNSADCCGIAGVVGGSGDAR